MICEACGDSGYLCERTSVGGLLKACDQCDKGREIDLRSVVLGEGASRQPLPQPHHHHLVYDGQMLRCRCGATFARNVIKDEALPMLDAITRGDAALKACLREAQDALTNTQGDLAEALAMNGRLRRAIQVALAVQCLHHRTAATTSLCDACTRQVREVLEKAVRA